MPEMTDPSTTDFDLVVAGAGCAGLSAALFGAIAGLKVLVLERTQWIGGTSALAAGALWIPNTHLADGSVDTQEKAAHYLELATGGRTPRALRDHFLALGPQAVRTLCDHSAVQLRAFAHHPDYLTELPDASSRGRVLECLPFDGRQLGAALALVRPPIPEFTVLGGMMVDRIDIGHLLNMTRSRASFAHSMRLVLRHAGDRLRYPRGTRLVMGNALVGRLLHSLRQRNVPVWTQVRTGDLVVCDGRVAGIEVEHQGRRLTVMARRGVVLAGGGFNDHPGFRAELIPPQVTHSPRSGSSPGILLDQALALGARIGRPAGSTAFWAPVSMRKRSDGSTAVFPHFVLDRAKPGTMVVDPGGHRFLNESCSYHQFVERMLERDLAHAWLIADRQALVKYGLGMVRPGGRGLGAFIRDRYLVEAQTMDALGARLGIGAGVLAATASRMNEMARSGVDADFQRGTTAYQRNLGDPAVAPNPTLRPIEVGPFYAVRLQPGDIGASAGLVTDANGRVLRGDSPIPGLFAAGNDMQSIMGSAYPGPGINLGPAIVFAYAAVQAAAAATGP
ncbi:MAG: fumarate reductase/succinate dehydrogenase flavoprotein domain protein [Ramlibacter sp.]|nr:fumarate reductase/succinate dehydrogenase flavoprotein domain protein [Ramlibacter sp.]